MLFRLFILATLPFFIATTAIAAENLEQSCDAWLSPSFYVDVTPQDVSACLQAGRTLVERAAGGETPLHLASAHAHDPRIVQALLVAGADLSLTTTEGLTPLHSAAATSSNPEILSLLLIWGADRDARLPGDACFSPIWTCASAPVHFAASRQDGTGVLATLLASGVDLKAQDEAGRTALHLAATYAREDMLELLLRAGNKASAEDSEGETALHAAARRPDISVRAIELLIAAGASPDDASDEKGVTPFHLAAAYSLSPKVFETLLESSQAPCKASAAGQSALDYFALNAALTKTAAYWELHEECAQ